MLCQRYNTFRGCKWEDAPFAAQQNTDDQKADPRREIIHLAHGLAVGASPVNRIKGAARPFCAEPLIPRNNSWSGYPVPPRKIGLNTYFGRMFKTVFDFCLPTKSTTVPAGSGWLDELKYDGSRIRLERDGDRVRLITRGGYNWTNRYPW